LAGADFGAGTGQAGERGERDAEPSRSGAGLVDGLVDRLVGREAADRGHVFAWVVAGPIGVAVAERVAVALGPLAGPVLQLRRSGRVEHRGTGRVLVRAEHAGAIAQGR